MKKLSYIMPVVVTLSVLWLLSQEATAQVGMGSVGQMEKVLVELGNVEVGDTVHFAGAEGIVEAEVVNVYPQAKRAIVQVASEKEEELVLRAELNRQVYVIKGALKDAVDKAKALVKEGDDYFAGKDYGSAVESYRKAVAIEVYPGYHKRTGEKILACASLGQDLRLSDRVKAAGDAIRNKEWQNAITLCREAISIYRGFGESELAILGYTEADLRDGLRNCNEMMASAMKYELAQKSSERSEEIMLANWCLNYHLPIGHSEIPGLKDISDKRKAEHPDSYCPNCDGAGVQECPRCLGLRSISVIDCKKCDKGKVVCDGCGGRGKITCESCDGEGKKIVACVQCAERGKVKCLSCQGTGSITCRTCRGKGKMLCPDCVGGSVRCTACEGRGCLRVLIDGSPGTIPCPKCRGKGRVRCLRCGGIGRVTCTECEGRKKVICLDCEGEGLVLCEKCRGEGKVVVACSVCKGSGKADCLTCLGSGKVTCPYCHGHCGHAIDCPQCSGRGLVVCSSCDGGGLVIRSQTGTVKNK